MRLDGYNLVVEGYGGADVFFLATLRLMIPVEKYLLTFQYVNINEDKIPQLHSNNVIGN